MDANQPGWIDDPDAQQADQYAGEGRAFHRARIPCVPYIPTPQYLFATPARAARSKLDRQRFYGEVVTFPRCRAAPDKMSIAEITGSIVELD